MIIELNLWKVAQLVVIADTEMEMYTKVNQYIKSKNEYPYRNAKNIKHRLIDWSNPEDGVYKVKARVKFKIEEELADNTIKEINRIIKEKYKGCHLVSHKPLEIKNLTNCM